MRISQSEGWYPHVEQELLSDGRCVFVASHRDFPGVLAQADTEADARSIFEANVQDRIADMASLNLKIPRTNYLRFQATFELEKPSIQIGSDQLIAA